MNGAHFINQFYRGSSPSISLIDEPIIPDPHADFCDRLLEDLILFQQKLVAPDQTTISDSQPEDETLEKMSLRHRWNCEHVRTHYELAEMTSVKPDDVADPRNALLQLMVAASPHDTVRVEILNNHDQIRENVTSRFESHFIGENYGTLVKMIDNVPDAVSPVEARPVYFQVPDGDKTVLVQAWLASAPNSILLHKVLSCSPVRG